MHYQFSCRWFGLTSGNQWRFQIDFDSNYRFWFYVKLQEWVNINYIPGSEMMVPVARNK